MKNEYGWICPRCKKVNAPWVSQCDCENEILPSFPTIPISDNTKSGFGYECCKNCSNNPTNNPNATGFCWCTLPYFEQGTSASNWLRYEWGLDGQLTVYFDNKKETT